MAYHIGDIPNPCHLRVYFKVKSQMSSYQSPIRAPIIKGTHGSPAYENLVTNVTQTDLCIYFSTSSAS